MAAKLLRKVAPGFAAGAVLIGAGFAASPSRAPADDVRLIAPSAVPVPVVDTPTVPPPQLPVVPEPTPEPEAAPVREVLEVRTGRASYYANSLAGRRTASGERYDPRAMIAAHRTFPFGTVLRVTSLSDETRSVELRVIDRGPFTKGRELDVSRSAAEALGMIRRGHVAVRIEVLSYGM